MMRALTWMMLRLKGYRAMRSVMHLSRRERRQFQAVHEQLQGTAFAPALARSTDAQRLLLRGLRLLSTDDLNREIETLGRAAVPGPDGKPLSKLACLIDLLAPLFRDWLFAMALSKLKRPDAAAHLLAAYLELDARYPADPPGQQHRQRALELIVHRAVTVGPGVFEATLDALAPLRAHDPDFEMTRRRLEGYVKTLRRPWILAHRGTPMGAFPENTIPGFQQGFDDGADGFETDVCVTKDGRIMLWHDSRPWWDASAYIRQLGLEPGMSYRPDEPGIFSRYRRPVHELTEAEFRRSRGYLRNDRTYFADLWDDFRRLLSRLLRLPALRPPDRPDRVYPGQIATLEDFARWLHEGDKHRLKRMKRINLDIKLRDHDASIQRFAAECKRILEQYGLADIAFCTGHSKTVMDKLRAAFDELGFVAGTTDVKDILTLFPDPTNIDLTPYESVGLPRLGVDAADVYAELVSFWRMRQPQKHLGTWTLNQDGVLRRIIALGVPWILTDNTPVSVGIEREIDRQYPGYIAAP